jgi:putative (di)nucleoside polyphosphate hydrolase
MSDRQTIDPASLPYRRGVGAMLINPKGGIFIGRRKGGRGKNTWQMPQGAIDEGETPAEAVLRELEEETGTRDAAIVAETEDWLSYDLPPELVGGAWSGRYRGQTQKWFALAFTGTDADFDLNAHHKPEFLEWRWAAIDELPNLIVPFKRRLYRDVIERFRDIPGRIAAGG